MPLSQEDRETLLEIARSTIGARLTDGDDPVDNPGPAPESPALGEPCGAFVTIHMRGELRGCIGNFVSDRPLYRTVAEMAVAAATEDPRFAPMTREELIEADLEISVLSPLREVKDPEEVEVGRHGVYIMRGANRGVLLPQVATDWGFDRGQFLDAVCQKAGLPPGCWRDPLAKILTFEAEVFGEEEGGEEVGG